MRHIIFNAFIVTFVTLTFNACTSPEKKVEAPIQFIIPPAPEEPKFMYLRTIRGESSFKKKEEVGFLDNLIGDGTILAGANFGKPYGVEVFKKKIYVTDTAFGVVFVIDMVTGKTRFLGDKNKGKLSQPVGVAVDNNENVFVTDSKTQRVFGYDKEGKLIFVLGNDDEFIRPTGLAINRDLEIMYVADTKGHTIRAFSLKGDFLFDIGERGSEDGQFNFPTNAAVDQNSGNLVVVDTQNFRVQIFDQDGNHIKTFGNIGDVPGTFARPKGVAVDGDGNIYVSDAAFDNVQIFDKTGEQLLMFFGKAGVNPGEFQQPTGLTFDEFDKLYVTENFAGRIQVFQYISSKWKKASPKEYKALMLSRQIVE